MLEKVSFRSKRLGERNMSRNTQPKGVIYERGAATSRATMKDAGGAKRGRPTAQSGS